MAVYYGFYNSINHDRCYDALQMSAIFDGIINDGIFQNVGTAFKVTANTGLTINVGIGRAWFNHTWTWNDAVLPLTLAAADQVKSRIDTIVIEVNSGSGVRANSIKVLKGTAAASPTAPSLTNTTYVHQYPLANIAIAPGATTITQSNITDRRGQGSSKWVTGILQTINTADMISQWQDEWKRWCTNSNSTVKTDWNNFKTSATNEKNTLITDINTYMTNRKAAVESFIANTENTFVQSDKIEYAARLVLAERFHEREDVTFTANGWAGEASDSTIKTQKVKLTKKTYLTANSNIMMYTCDSAITKSNAANYLTQYSYISKAEIVVQSGAPYLKAYCYAEVPNINIKVTIIGS